MMSENTDRWKSDGDCTQCRRQNYCKKKCKAYQKASERMIRKALYDAVPSLGGVMNYLGETKYK